MKTSQNVSLSIVIPAYNESRRIDRSLRDLQSFFQIRSSSNLEIILVVEKSTDDTLAKAQGAVGRNPMFKIIANPAHKGKGFAVKTGMLAARGEIVFFMDLDLSTPLVEVFHFMDHLNNNPDTMLAIGSRQHAQSQIIKKQNPLRQKMGETFNAFVKFFAIKGIDDTQCGFKAFRQQVVRPLFARQSLNAFAFDVEILLLAEKAGLKTDVLPVQWRNSPESKVRIVRDSLRMLWDLVRLRWRVRNTLKRNPFSSAELCQVLAKAD